MATTITAAHYFIWTHLYASTQTVQTPASKLRVVTSDKESSMNTLWQEEDFEQIYSRESLMEKAAKIEKVISVKSHEKERYDFDPPLFHENRFWYRRSDGIVMNKNHRTLHILEFKQTSDRNEDFPRVYCILLIRNAFCHVSENLLLRCLFYDTMNIYICFLC